MSVNKMKDFISEKYYKRIEFSKESSYYSIKILNKKNIITCKQKFRKKIPNPSS